MGKVDLIRDVFVSFRNLQGELYGRLGFYPVDLGNGHGWVFELRASRHYRKPTQATAKGTAGAVTQGGVAAAATFSRHVKLSLQSLLFQDGPPGHHLELLAFELALRKLMFQPAYTKGREILVCAIDALVIEFFLEVVFY